MNTLIYVAQIAGDEANGYKAKILDFPNLAFSADNLATLLREARAGLLKELTMMEAAGEDWPTPSSMGAWRQQADQEGMSLLLIDVQVDDTPVRVNISIGERLLQRLDEAAGSQDISRSGFIAAAVRRRLGETPGAKAEDSSTQRIYDEDASVARHVTDAIGPESAFGRAVAELDQRAIDGLRSLTSMIGKGQRRDGKDD